jgi:hypothetical protein
MKKISTLFLQVVVVAFGLGILVFMLWEPHLEGVNAHATSLREIYFDDPFLACAYIVSIAFFLAVYKAFRVLGYVREDRTFTPETLKALRTIKFSAITLATPTLAGIVYLFIARPGDDIAGGVAIGLGITLVSVVVAAAAAMFEQVVQKTLEH